MDKLYIQIDVDDSDILQDLKDMEFKQVKEKKVEKKSEEKPVRLLTDMATIPVKEKKTKKKKKYSLKDELLLTSDLNDISSTAISDGDYDHLPFVMLDDDFIDNHGLLEAYDFGKKKDGKKTKKDKTKIYNKEFDKEIGLLYDLLKEQKDFTDSLNKSYNALERSKTHGISKYSVDLAATINSAKSTKLSIIKEIANVKKVVADLNMKANSKKPVDSDNESSDKLASSFFNNIMNGGRASFLDNTDSYDDVTYSEYENNLNYDENIISNIKEQLVTDGYRSEEANKFIEYESRQVQVCVKKYVDTGEWEFVAKDKDGLLIPDYPVPSKKLVGKMKFADEGTYCNDSKGCMYDVIQVMSDDEPDTI